MQPVGWYLRRLRSMAPGEIAWRVRSSVRDVLDRPRLALGHHPRLQWPATNGVTELRPGFGVSDVDPGEWARPIATADERRWCEQLVERAELIAAHRLSFFDLEAVDLGHPIDWNRDHALGVAAPMRYAPLIDYRDRRVTGDCKLVWEPNRHHHLVVLARAFRASGDRRFAQALLDQLESWWEQCPFGYGMNWRSPLELGVRLINWVWAIDLILESGLVGGDVVGRLLRSAHLHLWEVSRKFSRGSSANNHLIGEAAGVFVGASYFTQVPQAAEWRAEAWAILCEEIERQTYPDGGGREQAVAYHHFVLQFFLVCAVVARRTGIAVPGGYLARLERMIDFLAGLSAGGPLPMLGDADDGQVLDLGGPRGDLEGVLCAGAVLFGRDDWKARVGTYPESARWLLGEAGRVRFNALPAAAPEPLRARAFRDTGLYLLQCGRAGDDDRVSVVVDCGELGLGALAAHGHADALAFTLRAFGTDVFIDPGTYDYFTHPDWRAYFRSTRAHNTLEVDDRDQSEMLGKFLWGSRAEARCVAWDPSPHGGRVVGEHDGYLRLPDPVRHRRSVELDGRARVLTVEDELVARGEHRITAWFHLAEHCTVGPAGPGRFEIATGGGTVILELDPRMTAQVLRGQASPGAGWVSRGYHRRALATSIRATMAITGDTILTSRIEIGPPARGCASAPGRS